MGFIGLLRNSWQLMRKLTQQLGSTQVYIRLTSMSMSRYDGDMTISLSSGLSIRVANDQFMVPAITYDTNGTRVENDTIKEFLFNGIGDQPATLGRYFLTAAYLMVNHDSETFALWRANPTTSSTLVSVIAQGTEADCGNLTGVIQPSVSGTGSSAEESAIENTTPVDAIAGGVVGGVVLFIAVGVATFILVRRRKRALCLQANFPQSPCITGHAGQEDHEGPTHEPVQIQIEPKRERYELPPEYKPRPQEMIGSGGPIFHEMDGTN